MSIDFNLNVLLYQHMKQLWNEVSTYQRINGPHPEYESRDLVYFIESDIQNGRAQISITQIYACMCLYHDGVMILVAHYITLSNHLNIKYDLEQTSCLDNQRICYQDFNNSYRHAVPLKHKRKRSWEMENARPQQYQHGLASVIMKSRKGCCILRVKSECLVYLHQVGAWFCFNCAKFILLFIHSTQVLEMQCCYFLYHVAIAYMMLLLLIQCCYHFIQSCYCWHMFHLACLSSAR